MMNFGSTLREGRSSLYEASVLAQTPRVLLAEDDEDIRCEITRVLKKDGFDVIEVQDGGELLDRIDSLVRAQDGRAIDLVISDIRMPVMSGLDLLERVRRTDWATPVILMTAFGDEDTRAEAKRLGAAAIFDKPFDIDDLRTAALHFAGVR